MRDRRFVAAHRGGPLSPQNHAFLACWAADCADRVLHFFSECSNDPRPKQALEIARLWAAGEVKTGAAMKASLAAHAAARQAPNKVATAAARAAGQAVATAHCADHCMGALLYAMKALEESGYPSNSEMDLQLAKLPDDLRVPVSEGVQARMKPFRIGRPH